MGATKLSKNEKKKKIAYSMQKIGKKGIRIDIASETTWNPMQNMQEVDVAIKVADDVRGRPWGPPNGPKVKRC